MKILELKWLTHMRGVVIRQTLIDLKHTLIQR